MRVRTCLLLLLCLTVCAGCARKKTTDELITDLKSSQDRDQIVAVRLLPQRKGDAARVVPALMEALSNKDGDVRWSAAIGLGYFGEQARDAIPALQTAQHDRDPRVREGAGVALFRIDPVRFPDPTKPRTGRGG